MIHIPTMEQYVTVKINELYPQKHRFTLETKLQIFRTSKSKRLSMKLPYKVEKLCKTKKICNKTIF